MNTPRHMLNVLRLAVALLFASALMSRCASMMTPTGGLGYDCALSAIEMVNLIKELEA